MIVSRRLSARRPPRLLAVYALIRSADAAAGGDYGRRVGWRVRDHPDDVGRLGVSVAQQICAAPTRRKCSEHGGTRRFPAAAPVSDGVPLAWRNLLANKRRLFRSSAGIAFAVLLMMVQLGFEQGFFEASLSAVRAARRRSVCHAALTNTASARATRSITPTWTRCGPSPASPARRRSMPIWQDFFWTSPLDDKPYLVRVFAFDPDAPAVLSLSGIKDGQPLLKKEDAVLVDSRSRAFLGMDGRCKTDRSQRPAGPDRRQICARSGFHERRHGGDERPAVRETAAGQSRRRREPAGRSHRHQAAPGEPVSPSRPALRAALPNTLSVLTKAEIVDLEEQFPGRIYRPPGRSFGSATIVGFVVGMLISYQIIYTDLSDQLPQYATLKAHGLRDRLSGAGRCSTRRRCRRLAGYLPAWLLCLGVYRVDRRDRAAAAAHDAAADAAQPWSDPRHVPGCPRRSRSGG